MVEPQVVAEEQGAWLVLAGDGASSLDPEQKQPPGLLGVGDFLLEAMIGGGLGNLTYDSLKLLASRVRRAAPTAIDAPVTSAEDVVVAVENAVTAATRCDDVRLHDIARVADEGWVIRGQVDSRSFEARTDPDGRVVHLKMVG